MPMETCRYTPYTELSTGDYESYLYHRNQEHLKEVQELLSPFPIGQDACITVVGSDGKLERHAQSRTEISILTRSVPDRDIAHELVDYCNEIFEPEGTSFAQLFDTGPDSQPEVKVLEDDTPLSFAFAGIHTRPHRVYPDRVLNACFVTGDIDTYTTSRKMVLDEIGGRTALGHKLRERIKDQVKESKSAIHSGNYKKEQCFHLEGHLGFEFYNENPAGYTTGFKGPFLRGTQRTLDLITARVLLEGNADAEELAHTLPTTTTARMRFLREHALADIQPEVETSFLWFLQKYHFAQERYKSGDRDQPIGIAFDSSVFHAHQQNILSFVSGV